MGIQTEFRFRLPKGFVDPDSGEVHRDGVMRLATARDEIVPLQDYRVQANRAYLVIVLLSRVVTSLGERTDVSPATIESLFSTDLVYLQEFYRKINDQGVAAHEVSCPGCNHGLAIDMATGAVRRAGEDGGEAPVGPG